MQELDFWKLLLQERVLRKDFVVLRNGLSGWVRRLHYKEAFLDID